MRNPFYAALAGSGLAWILSSATTAMAQTTDYATGAVCQLSIPTTDTKFRPKATGARNESMTSGSFVICPLETSAATGTQSIYTEVTIKISSMDGVTKSISCTAASGYPDGGAYDIRYSAKGVNLNDSARWDFIHWFALDFGGNPGDPIVGSAYFSVTCLLPPQSAINFVQADH